MNKDKYMKSLGILPGDQWRCRDGSVISMGLMDLSHLEAVARHLDRTNPEHPQRPIISAMIYYRYTGNDKPYERATTAYENMVEKQYLKACGRKFELHGEMAQFFNDEQEYGKYYADDFGL